MKGTIFTVKRNDRIPENIWQDFCTDLPWCSDTHSFDSSPQDTLLALILGQLLDTCITWCQYDKLKKLDQRFKEISLDKGRFPQNINNFYQRINEQFSQILVKVLPNDKFSYKASTNERQKYLKEDITKRRQYIQDSLKNPSRLEIMANISRAMAISVYLQKDFNSIGLLQHLVTGLNRETIVQDLLSNQLIQTNDHFILEDQLLIPISYCLQIPIHFYSNFFEQGGKTLTRRRIHAQNDEQALIFLIDRDAGNARILYKYHSSIDIKSHMDDMMLQSSKKLIIPKVQEQVIQSDVPLNKNKELMQCIKSVIDHLLKQMTIENSKISELWLKKINEIILQGDTQQLISKKQQIVQFQPQLIQGISDLQTILNQEKGQENSFSNFITSTFDQTLQFFENLIITQVTVVRDTLFDHIASISTPKMKDERKVERIISSENNLPAKPKILDNKGLFNKNNFEYANQTFHKQKLISNQSHIEPKFQDQDLPDPSENLTENEVDCSEVSSSMYSDSQEKQKQASNVLLADIKEYHTSEDESDSDKIPVYNKQSRASSESQQIIVEDEQIFDYQAIIDGDHQVSNNKEKQEIIPLETSNKQKEKISVQPKTSIVKDKSLGNFNSTNNNLKDRDSFQQMFIQRGRSSVQGTLKLKSSYEAASDDENINLTNSVRQNNSEQLSFIPNNSKKSINIQNRMTRSQHNGYGVDSKKLVQYQQNLQQKAKKIQDQKEKINYELMNQSKISESEEFINQSLFLEFECPICYDTTSNYQEIKTIHDNHKICVACLASWIKVKFNSGQWNLKFFKCPIQIEKKQKNQQCDHLIDIELIKQVLSDDEFGLLCERSMQVGYLDIECPWEDCQVSIRGMPPKNSDGIKCPECSKEICWVCRDKSHEGKLCPQRLQEIKGALQDERIGCCPECLEIFMKNDGGCQHVQCYKCAIDFCFACSAHREPIMKHGTHYHRVGCELRVLWMDPDTKEEILDEEYDPVDCEICKKTGKACPRPMDLQSFKKLAHLNF